MATLTTAPMAQLIDRLFQEAEAAHSPEFASIPHEERERLMRSKDEYVTLYGLLKDSWLPVSAETGRLMYVLARAIGAKNIVEFGTSFGLSTLHLAAALRDNGGGMLITSEFEPSKVARARRHLFEGGVADLVDVREGDAMKTLATNLPDSIDLLVLDGAKALYGEILALVESRLRTGALVLADDTDYNQGYLDYIRSPENGYLSIPFAEDVELSLRIG
ncbi:O-methyltransferase [Methylobacillus sp. Pita1]|uniref:O-methyltransferase n=1 Tax=Methylobacillus sp. Pita1 TaxID=3382642 RepID=UPI0038B5E8FE